MKFYLLFSLILLTSCATKVNFNTPGNRFETPETKGKLWSGDVSTGIGRSIETTTSSVVADIFFNTFDSVDNQTKITKENALYVNANLGILERLDVTVKGSHDAPTFIGGKFQFWGKPASVTTEGFKASFSAAIGSMSDEKNLEVSKSDGTSKRTYKGKVEAGGGDFGINLGYRFNKHIIVYLNNYYTMLTSKSSLTSTNEGTHTVNGDVTQYGSLLGIKVGERFFFIGEAGYSKFTWRKSTHKTDYPIGLEIGFGW